ncbi:helix-turn-helix domain-containing protein [Bifidobacterium choloepi]|uniref:helix-turn-helix domain-containing protein n=1 Tax=Bifidobacterium choloepi TaxID=2614131 RepID=UPI0018C8B911|nr:helix-turn-helix domain-containing protein [Bifidobacterium choloepi]
MEDDVLGDELLTTTEVATRLGVSKSTVIRLLDSGAIPSVRYGRGRRLTKASDVTEFQERSRTATIPMSQPAVDPMRYDALREVANQLLAQLARVGQSDAGAEMTSVLADVTAVLVQAQLDGVDLDDETAIESLTDEFAAQLEKLKTVATVAA